MFPELALIHLYSCAQTKCDMIRDVLNYISTAAATDAIFALVKMALDLCKWRQSERESVCFNGNRLGACVSYCLTNCWSV